MDDFYLVGLSRRLSPDWIDWMTLGRVEEGGGGRKVGEEGGGGS